MSLDKVDLKFDNDRLDYAPGDTISGHVELVVAAGTVEVTCMWKNIADIPWG